MQNVARFLGIGSSLYAKHVATVFTGIMAGGSEIGL